MSRRRIRWRNERREHREDDQQQDKAAGNDDLGIARKPKRNRRRPRLRLLRRSHRGW